MSYTVSRCSTTKCELQIQPLESGLADVERVAGRVGAEGEQVVVREQFIGVVAQAAQVGRAVGQLHAMALQVARPADRVLG